MKSVVISAEHGIIFIVDPRNKDAIVPEYEDDEIVSATESCISVAVRPYMDGDVEVSLSEVAPTKGLELVASHSLLVPNGIIAIATAEIDRVLDQEVSPGSVRVSVWVDSKSSVTRVSVVVDSSSVASRLVN
ncbi:MAG: hypothetical protein AAGC76_00260 [Luteibacter sp.]|uniref:hypothetical protein n=1 Tax=Luteibacter TaxID=242605 RepID=UPI0012DFF5A2|nr:MULTISPECIES: hypothetical protein [unclassified Luteibacter]MDQ7994265.1 hypothetical protein [Luteibacter sp.]MDQ8048565.1 hypothetical protein [Luteibacter sp.]MDR6642243.1 hypothetical protein [Luteibacter sp. 1214]